jgi:peptide/nickel transport system substrate-binding protein
MMTVTRRRVLGGAAALGGTAALTATGFGIGSAAAQSRKVLIIACQNDISIFDPHIARDDPGTLMLRNVYDSLVRVVGRPPHPIPGLATAWTVSEDGLEYTFDLNPNAKFHDGSPVTAEDVRYSFERQLRIGRGNAWMIAGIVDGSGVEPVDTHKVRIRLTKSFAPFLAVLPWIRIVNSKLVEANKGSDDAETFLRTETAGSGPYRLTRVEPGNLYELVRAENDWHEGGGNLEGAIIRIVRESSRQRLMLQTGEAHVAINLTADDIAQLEGRDGVVAKNESEYYNFGWKLNVRHGPFADINLRKAVNHAFDYQAMLGVSGPAKLAHGPLYEGQLGYDPDLPVYRTDMAKAKEYLAKTQYAAGGLKLVATHITGHEQQRRWSLVLLDSLRNLGFELEVRPVTWPDMVALTRSPETCPDLFPIFSGGNYADPDGAAFVYHSKNNGSYENPTYANPEVDRLILEARSEVDETKRAALYKDFQKIVTDDAPEILGVIPVRPLGMRAEIQGFEYTPIRAATFDFLPLSLA